MTPDLTTLPYGQAGWDEFILSLPGTGEEAEGLFIEFKGREDLGNPVTRNKVAKFIMAAYHRDPEVVKGRFEGRALLVLGYDTGTQDIVGIPEFSNRDLRNHVESLTGLRGPSWTLHRINLENRRLVAVVTVAAWKPGDRPCFCKKDTGDKKTNDLMFEGSLYVRFEDESRHASAVEIEEISARMYKMVGAIPAKISVRFTEPAIFLACDHRLIEDYLDLHCTNLLDGLPSRHRYAPGSVAGVVARSIDPGHLGRFPPILMPGEMTEPRTPEKFRDEVEAWEKSVREEWNRMLRRVALHLAMPTQIEIVSDKFLNSPQLKIELDPAIEPFDYKGPILSDAKAETMLPKRPVAYGPRKVSWAATSGYMPGMLDGLTPHAHFGNVLFDFEEDAYVLRTNHEKLFTQTPAYTRQDELVLVSIDRRRSVPFKWRLVADNIDEPYEGTGVLPVAEPFDLTPKVRELLSIPETTEGHDPA